MLVKKKKERPKTTFLIKTFNLVESFWRLNTTAHLTSLVYLRFSFSQMSSRRSSWIWFARGLKRNLEHLDVRGSIILQGHTDMQLGQGQSHSVFVCRWLFYVSWPADVVTDEAEAGGAGLLLHGPPESSLSWCRHGVGLIQDDDLKRRTWLPTTDTNKVRRSFRVC